ncbi:MULTISPECIES: YigZ family protein [unclassified Aureispira]|uniref:IMPACT family protein n=1 Tax=unclassified Aureispira TaxID=2649989 RepID=UPI000907705C|nr:MULTISPECIES: YigZ family protein [unclassified Aureispira]WMX13534.1 YigZ family protein [Aureispira sp. CCB-E]
MKDTYFTIEKPSIGEYKEKGSKFIAYTFPVYSEDEVKTCLEEVKKEHFKARHHCYAYRIGLDGKRFRANDDGEPSGTAGRPILGQIDSFGLSNVLSVVVRYFGGTKLGTSGLKRAYKESTRDAFEQAQIVEKIVEDQFHVVFDYVATSDVMNYIKNEAFTILNATYEEKTTLLMTIRQSDVKRFKESLEKIIGVKVNKV